MALLQMLGNLRIDGFPIWIVLLIIAVLERKLKAKLADKDVYVNIAGGLRVEDPAADLAVAAAIISSITDIPVEKEILLLGEVGLLGELRPVSQEERRLKEAASLGFSAAVCPTGKSKKDKKEAIRRLPAEDLAQAMAYLGFDKAAR